MSFFQDVQAALDTRLDALTGGTPIAWENVEYTPVRGTAYLRPTTLMAPSSLMDLIDLQMNEGIYQIDVIYPLGNGNGAALAKADAIYDHFKGDITLVSNGVTVNVKQISRRPQVIREDAWLMTSVEVNFKVYDN